MLVLATQLKAQDQTEAVEATRTFVGGTYHGTFQPEKADVALMPELRAVRNNVNKSQYQDDLASYKDSLNSLKRAANLHVETTANKTTGTIDPVRVMGFNALGNQGTPSDNTLAIGKNGKMIAAVNSSMRVYQSTGAPDAPIAYFPNFWNSITNKTDMCDPLVLYDPSIDRFVIFTQVCDRVTTDNRILVAVSATNNPSGAYHYYSFRANLREIIGSGYPFDTWFDYPKMAVSGSDIFITGNLFRNVGTNSYFIESVIFQIDKTACSNGSPSPTAFIFNNLPNNPFTLVPAGHGRDAHYGDEMHFCATRNLTSANVLLMYTVTGKVGNNPGIASATVSVPTYYQPADGVQQGTNVMLNSGDMRGMSAIYVDGTVHFAYHSNGPNSFIAINYNRLRRSGNSWSVQNKLISFPQVDCAYPALASMGWTDQDQSVLVGFNYSGNENYPGIRALLIDHDMNVSNAIELNTGIKYVDFLSSNGSTRWGDYSGITREHNASRPTVWTFGMYGNSASRWSNYISKVETSSWAVPTNDVVSQKHEAVIYPNPVVDTWHLKLQLEKNGKLSVQLYDINGRKLQDIFNSNVSAGEAVFSFNKNGLANATYFVRILLDNELIADEKIVVTK